MWFIDNHTLFYTPQAQKPDVYISFLYFLFDQRLKNSFTYVLLGLCLESIFASLFYVAPHINFGHLILCAQFIFQQTCPYIMQKTKKTKPKFLLRLSSPLLAPYYWDSTELIRIPILRNGSRKLNTSITYIIQKLNKVKDSYQCSLDVTRVVSKVKLFSFNDWLAEQNSWFLSYFHGSRGQQFRIQPPTSQS